MPTFYAENRSNLLLFQSIPENGGGKIRLWQHLPHRAWDQGRVRKHAHVWEEAHLPQDRQQLPVPWGRRLLCPVDEAKEWRTLVGRGHAPEEDDHPPAGGGDHLLDAGHDIMHNVWHTRSKGDVARDVR